MSDHSHAEPKSLSQDPYVRIWAILLVLLIVSVLGPEVSKHIPAPYGKLVMLFTAFGIAIVKAGMVVKNFMHINVEKKYIGYLLVTMLALMTIFMAGISPDVMRHEGHRWSNDSAKRVVEEGLKNAGAGHHAH